MKSSAVNPTDTALYDFTAHVLDLVRRVSKSDLKRFIKTVVKPDDLAKLGKFFTELARLKNVETDVDASTDAMKSKFAARDLNEAAE
jgi:hypothetical protein